MRCFIQFVTTPTVDFPGTLLFLHFDQRRYLVGNLAEGAQRACQERGVTLRKVEEILLTGRTEWSNIGGMLGMFMEISEVQSGSREALQAAKAKAQKLEGSARISELKTIEKEEQKLRLRVHGPPNLNHMVATSRRFVFRRGLPLEIAEYAGGERADKTSEAWEPTWSDDFIRVHVLSILPDNDRGATTYLSRKRGFDEANDNLAAEGEELCPERANKVRKQIVTQMFNSSWRFDRLTEKPLSEVQLPAAIFVRNPDTKELARYAGPLPGGDEPVPDVTVLVRDPWPGSAHKSLPKTTPAKESVSYIIRNHPQRGRFMPEKAEALGVPKGDLWAKLARGEVVQNAKGEDVTPDMVLKSGKQGGGVAVIDLPTVEYVDGLVSRREWQAREVMEGVESIIWILGPGVAADARIRQFQENMSHLIHVMSCPEYCSNTLTFDSIAKLALRHNYVDPTIFPRLEAAAEHTVSPALSNSSPSVVPARRGLALVLEPRYEFESDQIIPALDLSETANGLAEELGSFQNAPIRFDVAEDEHERQRWKHSVPCDGAEIIVLGTGSSHPAKSRNVSGTLVRVPGCGSYLLDCGEGTLGTLSRMFPPTELREILRDLKMIWVSHLHADHHLGTTSVIKAWHESTARSSEAESDTSALPKLTVVSHANMLHWLHEYGWAEEVVTSRLTPLAAIPAKGGSPPSLHLVTSPISYEADASMTDSHLAALNLKTLQSVYVNHCRGAQAVSLTFANGLKISYSGDCRPSADFAAIGRDSHVLIHEATFEDNMRGEAFAKKHSTAGEALIVATEMNARACILTHFSQRYPYMPDLGAQIRDREASPTVKELEHVLEQHEEGASAENAEAPIDGPGSSTWTDSAAKTASLDNLISSTISTKGGRAATAQVDRMRLIDEADIRGLIQRTGVRVIFAFDYMRLRIDDIPKLERKQPLLREIYESDVAEDANGDVHNCEQDNGAADRKKLAKAQRSQMQRNKKKAKRDNQPVETEEDRANAKKWADVTAYVEEKAKAAGLEFPRKRRAEPES